MRLLATPLIQVCIGLHYLATGSFQSTVSQILGVSQSTVSRCYGNFATCVFEHLRHLISFHNIEDVKQGFSELCLLPQVCGAIDCTHIEILRPSINFYPNEYINRKGWHSINVLSVCDYKGKFLEVIAEWPGSVHDSRIFRQLEQITNYFLEHNYQNYIALLPAGRYSTTRNSRLYDNFCAGHFENAYLLGDGGFGLTPFLMTPYRNPNTDAERRFNYNLSRGRVAIEMAFGRVKRRFACLYKLLQMPLQRVCRVIVVCFILHNLAIQLNDPDVEHREMNQRNQPVLDVHVVHDDGRLNRDGKRRQNLLTRLFEA